MLAHLGATDGVKLTVRLEIEAEAPIGFDDAQVRTASENATTLKFEANGFENS